MCSLDPSVPWSYLISHRLSLATSFAYHLLLLKNALRIGIWFKDHYCTTRAWSCSEVSWLGGKKKATETLSILYQFIPYVSWSQRWNRWWQWTSKAQEMSILILHGLVRSRQMWIIQCSWWIYAVNLYFGKWLLKIWLSPSISYCHH